MLENWIQLLEKKIFQAISKY